MQKKIKLNSKILAAMADDPQKRSHVAKHPRTNAKTLLKLLETGDKETIRAIFNRKDLPDSILSKMYDCNDYYIKWKMSQMKLPVDILKKFAEENNPNFIFNLAYNKNDYPQFKEIVNSKFELLKEYDSQIKSSKILILYCDKDIGYCVSDLLADYPDTALNYKNIQIYDDEIYAQEICQNEKFDLVICDHFRSKVLGDLIVKEIKEKQPDISSIIWCGNDCSFSCYQSVPLLDHFYNLPFEIDEFYNRVTWILGHRILQQEKSLNFSENPTESIL